ncbi:box A-binding factor-like isoform X2 [Anopheles albimanus]|nr:box A-binding factor-like isoform X2 [Anopheles albimanus]XP_035775683.1 box A-binding factor-like isoform X2 [Anopheles albimanus]
MELLLRFMYNGTVIVDNAELEALMKHAEHLRIKGLTQRVRSGPPSPVPPGSVQLGRSDSSGGGVLNNGHNLHGSSSSPPLYTAGATDGGGGGGGGPSGALHIPASPTHSESEDHAHHHGHHTGSGRLLKRKWNEDLEDELNSETSSDMEFTNHHHIRNDYHHHHQQQQQNQQQQQHNHNLNHHPNLNSNSAVGAGGLEQGSRRSPPSMVFRLPRIESDRSFGTGAVDYTSPGGGSAAQQQQQQQQQALFPHFDRFHGNFIASVASAAAAVAATTTTAAAAATATVSDEGIAATGNGAVGSGNVGPTHNDSTGSTDSFPTRSPRLMDVPAVAPGEKWFQGRLQFMLSQRGKPLLVHDGHSFGIQYIRKDKKYWQCNLSRKYNCKARVTTTDTGDIIVTNNEHCHTEIRQHLRKDYKTMKLAATLAATRASFEATNLAVASSANTSSGHATTAAAVAAVAAAAAAVASAGTGTGTGTQQPAIETDQLLTLNLSSNLWPIKRETNQCNE